MDKNEVERQYRKGLITLHEYLLKIALIEKRITEDEYNSITQNIVECFEDLRKTITDGLRPLPKF